MESSFEKKTGSIPAPVSHCRFPQHSSCHHIFLAFYAMAVKRHRRVLIPVHTVELDVSDLVGTSYLRYGLCVDDGTITFLFCCFKSSAHRLLKFYQHKLYEIDNTHNPMSANRGA